jgi:hypothetical protein
MQARRAIVGSQRAGALSRPKQLTAASPCALFARRSKAPSLGCSFPNSYRVQAAVQVGRVPPPVLNTGQHMTAAPLA